MLAITNGRDIFLVSKGAYRSLYKDQGFRIMGEVSSSPRTHTDPKSWGEGFGDSNPDECGFDSEAYLNGKYTPDECNDPEENSPEDGDEDQSSDKENNPDPTDNGVSLSDMSKSQLVSYAEELGIKLTGEETKRELRASIRRALS